MNRKTILAPQSAFKARHAALLASVSALAGLGIASPAFAAPHASPIASQADFARLSRLAIDASLTDQRVLPGVSARLAELSAGVLPIAPMPVLSAGLVGSESTVRRGDAALFLGYSNYPAFIARAELRVFAPDAPLSGPPHAVVEADRNGLIRWTPSTYAGDAMRYVYRVYDRDGRYDETAPQPLTVLSAVHMLPIEPVARADFGLIDSAAIRQIPLDGAQAVAVEGQTSAPDQLVRVAGQIAPADAAGRFAAVHLQPAGCSAVAVSVTGPCSESTIQHVVPDPAQTVPATAMGAGDGLSIAMADPQTDAVATASIAADNPYAIRVRTDAARVDPVLAAGLVESERAVVRGRDATFIRYTNYPAMVARGEVRIFRADASPDGTPLAVVPADRDGVARWTPGADAEGDLFYVYRVYDRDGQFDETAPQELTVVDTPFEGSPPPRPLFGSRDEAAVRNIPFGRTATVTVTGHADAEEVVRVGGQMIPLQSDGRFVSQQIVARDARQVWVTVGQGEQTRFTAMRDIGVKKSDWFIVGQGDLTFVSSKGNGPAVEVSGDPIAAGEHVTGRAAFYAKGTFASGWKVTSSLDTGETLLKDLFSNLDRKDPRQLLRRLNSNEYYTTYGDDSALVEDAPTQGRFYLKVQKDRSSLLIGNYVADIRQAELAQLNRGTFGAIASHQSVKTTSFGESRLQVTAFASDPGTIPGRDEFRGTGGSLYYLQRRDVTVGSERLAVEVRDRITGVVLSRRSLQAQEDYSIDYFQGRLTLLQPLSSYAADSATVRDGTASAGVPVLVANYEYTPAVGDVGGYTVGGRAAAWIGDTVRLGVTGQRETTGTADQTLLGTDATVRLHPGTYVKAEVAQTEGPGFGQSNSVDGGLTFTNYGATGRANVKAMAYRAEVAVNFTELAGGKPADAGAVAGAGVDKGKFSAWFEHLDAGFGANAQLTASATERWGAQLALPIGTRTALAAKVQHLRTDAAGSRTVGSADVTQRLGGGFTLAGGLRYSQEAVGLVYNSTESGKRTDAALQLGYKPEQGKWSVYGFGQATLDRDAGRRGNNRVGLGGKVELSDRQSLAAEVSEGDGGLGASATLNHRYGRGSETYLGYALVTDRVDQGLEPSTSFTRTNRGTLTLGARHRFSSALSIHGENKLGHGGTAPSLTRGFGLDWTPTERWSFSGSFENGHIDDVTTGRFRRTAATFGLAYTSKGVQFGTNVEGRFERGAGRSQNVWLFRNHASVMLNPDWRALARLNFAIADNTTADVNAADYVEGTIGFAYRPVANDRLNLLTSYTYLKDMGPVGQVTQGGQIGSPKQKSQIFAIDANYDLTRTLTLGGKYAYRKGSVSLTRDSDTYVTSNTWLGVARIDWRLVRQWDVLVEGHYLSADRAGDHRWGGLAAVYRHLGNNAKVGVGYSFSDFSSDLSNQSYTSKGVFVNLLGKF